MIVETTYLFNDNGRRFRVNVADVKHLIKKKKWSTSKSKPKPKQQAQAKAPDKPDIKKKDD